MFVTRRKNYSILTGLKTASARYSRVHDASPLDSHDASDLDDGSDDDDSFSRRIQGSNATLVINGADPKYPPKYRRVFGLCTIRTPNSSRFANHLHSRILVKFPFLVEMFYWAISFFFYRLTAVMAQVHYGGAELLWDVGQGHARSILNFESWLFGTSSIVGKESSIEYRIQNWFLSGADGGDSRGIWLTILDRGYSLIHIPGTVGFIAFYYWYAPSFNRFATVRRTMTLLNLCAFCIFLMYPTMPPRFLPAEYGFVDTVNAEDAQSVWMSGQYVNKLAAMPSMHFGYAFAIGCVFVFESGFVQQYFSKGKMGFLFDCEDEEAEEFDDFSGVGANGCRLSPAPPALPQKSALSRVLFLFYGIFYPSWILLTIVATGNHYFLDAFVAALCGLVAFLANRVLLNFFPLEDCLLWVLRLEKPQPTTGWHRRKVKSRV